MSGKPILPILVSAILFAQTAPKTTIQVTTRLVEVNAIVRDKGQIVRGLTKDDFILLDDNRPQKIATFSTTTSATPTVKAAPLPPNLFTNIPGYATERPNNVTVVLMDGLNTTAFDKPYAHQQFLKFLKQVHDDDRVAVYALGRKLVVLSEFTSDASRLVAAVEHFADPNLGVAEATDPNSPDYGSTPADVSAKGSVDGGYTGLLNALQDAQQAAADFATLTSGEITVAALESIANHLASVPGRKNLIWITGNIPLRIAFMLRPNQPQAADRNLLGEETYRAVKALNDADIAVYPVDARGLIPGPALIPTSGHMTVAQAMKGGPSVSSMSVSASHDSMIGIAHATGGLPFYNSNDIKGAIRRAIDDSEFTYNLGYYPDKIDDTTHVLKLRVKDKNYEIRSRTAYRAGKEDVPTEQQRQNLLRDALWSPVSATGIGLAVRADKVDQPKAGSLHLTMAISSGDLTLDPKDGKWAGAVDYLIAQRSADGRFLTRTAKGVALNFDEQQVRQLRTDGVTISDTVEPVAGAAEIRVVLLDRTSGKIGSVTVPLRQ